MMKGCVMHKVHNSRIFTFWVFPLLLKFHKFLVRAESPVLHIQLFWNFTCGFIMMRGCVMHKGHNSRIFTFWVIPLLLKFHVEFVSGPYLLYYWSNCFETSHVDLSWSEGVSCTRVITLGFLLFELVPFYYNFMLSSCPGHISYTTDPIVLKHHMCIYYPVFVFYGTVCIQVFYVRPMPLNSRACCPQTALVCKWVRFSELNQF